jgi:hypothetical protein
MPSGHFAAKQKGPGASQTKWKLRLRNDFVSGRTSQIIEIVDGRNVSPFRVITMIYALFW